MSRILSDLKLLAAGVVLGLLFPPIAFPVLLIFPVFYPLLQTIFQRSWQERFKAGLIFGFGFFIVLLKWLNIVGLDALILLSLICSIWWAISAALGGLFTDSKFWPLWVATSFTTFELLRDRVPFGGFGWGQLGILLVDTPFSGLIGLVGQVGATFFVYLGLATVFLLLKSQGSMKQRVLVFLSISFAFALISASAMGASGIKTNTDRSITIIAVQGGVERTGLGTLGKPRAVLERHIEATLLNLKAVNNADLVIWPESSVDLDPFQDLATLKMLLELDEKVVPPLLIGTTIHDSSGNRINSSQILQNGSLATVYEKRRLVPFGEFLPLREIVETYTSRAALLTTDYVPGSRVGKIEISGIDLGVLICFEIADDALIHDGIGDNSATVVQTNNATYQYLGQTEQQVLYTRVRAIETSKPVISIATSGISVIVNEAGKIEQSISQDDTGILQYQILERTGTSIASKIQLFVKFFVIVVFVSGLVLRIFARFRIAQ